MFEGWDAVVLARAQFAFTMSFHIVFPAFSIGLASYLAVLEALWLWTGREVFINLFNYWLKIFAVAFGMGVVSGIVMSYQFGTNWSAFSDKAGPVIGPLMAYEVLTAFFLEAGFLGVMLFGLERVGHRLHFFATLMVAVGTLISALWILSANSWMQTPTGHAVNAAGQFVAADWFKVIFNPSFPYRLVHMVLAAYLTTALVVGIHTPEFPFERSAANVQAALKRHGITYPVAQDNDSKTWNAYRNQYWPSQYIIDQQGKIVFQHDGEGQYEQIDRTVARLLSASS